MLVFHYNVDHVGPFDIFDIIGEEKLMKRNRENNPEKVTKIFVNTGPKQKLVSLETIAKALGAESTGVKVSSSNVLEKATAYTFYKSKTNEDRKE